jgi:hypothetical protein
MPIKAIHKDGREEVLYAWKGEAEKKTGEPLNYFHRHFNRGIIGKIKIGKDNYMTEDDARKLAEKLGHYFDEVHGTMETAVVASVIRIPVKNNTVLEYILKEAEKPAAADEPLKDKYTPMENIPEGLERAVEERRYLNASKRAVRYLGEEHKDIKDVFGTLSITKDLLQDAPYCDQRKTYAQLLAVLSSRVNGALEKEESNAALNDLAQCLKKLA